MPKMEYWRDEAEEIGAVSNEIPEEVEGYKIVKMYFDPEKGKIIIEVDNPSI